jgi:elongation factor Ts
MESKEKINLVKNLREKTLLPIAECTKILEEAGWKIENLNELITKYSSKIAQKKKDRATNEGKIFTHFHNNILFYVLLSCETDFVASNEKFNELGSLIVKKFSEGEENFDSLISEYIAKIGENISLAETGKIECNFFYLHNGKKLAAISSSSNDENLNKKICFHIVSMANSQDMSNLESLMKQIWFESSEKTFEQFLKQNNISIEKFLYFE